MKHPPELGLWASAAALGGLAYMLPSLIATLTKGKAMTAMEKALGNLVAMLWQRITEYEEKIEKLQKERDERPIQAQLDAAVNRANASDKESEDLREEVASLRRQVTKLSEKSPKRRSA